MRGQIFLCREDIEQDAVQQVRTLAGVEADKDVFQLRNLHFDLVVMLSENRDIVLGVFLSVEQRLDVGEDRSFFVIHVLVNFHRVFIEIPANHEGDVLGTIAYRVYQLAADMGKPEIQEIVVGIMQVHDQSLDREPGANRLGQYRRLFGEEIDYGNKREGIDAVHPADFADGFVAEAEVDAETVCNQQHRVIIGDEVDHSVRFFVKSLFVHVPFSFYAMIESMRHQRYSIFIHHFLRIRKIFRVLLFFIDKKRTRMGQDRACHPRRITYRG